MSDMSQAKQFAAAHGTRNNDETYPEFLAEILNSLQAANSESDPETKVTTHTFADGSVAKTQPSTTDADKIFASCMDEIFGNSDEEDEDEDDNGSDEDEND